jgi:peroxiredoxin
MIRNKRRFLLLVACALVVAGLLLSGNRLSTDASAESTEIEKLFKELGIAKVDTIKEPVDFSLVNLQAKIVQFSEYRGKIVFLNFWATWCTPCRIEMPAMEKLYNKFKSREFDMVAVSLKESVKDVRSFFKQNKLTFTALVDPKGKVAQKLRVISIPTTLIINKEGLIIGYAIGPRDWESKMSFALFEKLIKMN